MKVSAAIAAFTLVALLAYFGWTIARKWNYAWSYESMVKETVCEMVKPEHLKHKCD